MGLVSKLKDAAKNADPAKKAEKEALEKGASPEDAEAAGELKRKQAVSGTLTATQ